MGILVNEATKARIKFLADPALIHRKVNESCERCRAVDCQERQAEPILLRRREQVEIIKETLLQMGVK